MIQFQTHHHTKTCKKHKNSSCIFGFPIPPIDETCILHPLCNENNDMKIMQKKLSFLLQDKSYSKNIMFSQFLAHLGIHALMILYYSSNCTAQNKSLRSVDKFTCKKNPFVAANKHICSLYFRWLCCSSILQLLYDKNGLLHDNCIETNSRKFHILWRH